MADFDLFERWHKQALATRDLAAVERIVRAMAGLTDEHRPTFARGRSERELAAWMGRARRALRAQFAPGETFAFSTNNVEGKDLHAVSANREIELKSAGAKTDANMGVGAVARALGEPDPLVLRQIMSGSARERRQIWQQTADPARRDRLIIASRVATTLDLARYFRRYLAVGRDAPRSLSQFVTAVALGHSTEREIRAYLAANAASRRANLPLLLRVDWKAGLVAYLQGFVPGEPIRVMALPGSATERAAIHLRGTSSGQTALLYPHYKNGYHLPDGREIPAAAWVRTACFHIWIGHAD